MSDILFYQNTLIKDTLLMILIRNTNKNDYNIILSKILFTILFILKNASKQMSLKSVQICVGVIHAMCIQNNHFSQNCEKNCVY